MAFRRAQNTCKGHHVNKPLKSHEIPLQLPGGDPWEVRNLASKTLQIPGRNDLVAALGNCLVLIKMSMLLQCLAGCGYFVDTVQCSSPCSTLLLLCQFGAVC